MGSTPGGNTPFYPRDLTFTFGFVHMIPAVKTDVSVKNSAYVDRVDIGVRHVDLLAREKQKIARYALLRPDRDH